MVNWLLSISYPASVNGTTFLLNFIKSRTFGCLKLFSALQQFAQSISVRGDSVYEPITRLIAPIRTLEIQYSELKMN